jgi:hypothetical protein
LNDKLKRTISFKLTEQDYVLFRMLCERNATTQAEFLRDVIAGAIANEDAFNKKQEKEPAV